MPFLVIIIIFIIWFTVKSNRATNKDKEAKNAFWAKENEANATKKQDISQLPYITILPESLPFGAGKSPESVSAEKTMYDLADKKILNLTGISNTDLKLTYGAANLPVLTEYDQNFTLLAKTILQWGEALNQEGCLQEAIRVLEFGVACRSDITANYTLLAQLYCQTGQQFKIRSLLDTAGQLNSLSKNTIILRLSEFVHTGQ